MRAARAGIGGTLFVSTLGARQHRRSPARALPLQPDCTPPRRHATTAAQHRSLASSSRAGAVTPRGAD